jgi:alpha-D-ribose 1-methylphosphonate 5-triphosphate synthase subunit PhnI
MYVAVKGGERAIDNAHAWLAEERRGDRDVAELSIAQIREQLKLAVNRVMAEGSLYDPDLAALAIKQARGDLIEAVFLIRAYRTTLPRFGASHPVDTGAMACDRRISATFKDLPGGQVLGPTFDYTHRLLDFALAAEGLDAPETPKAAPADAPMPHVTGFLAREDLIQPEPEGGATPRDLTREPLDFPADRPLRLQALTRGDEGFVLSMAYSTQRGYGRNHPFVGELADRHGAGGDGYPRAGVFHRDRRGRADRMRDREPVHRVEDRAAPVHARLRARLRPDRAQGDFHGAGRPGAEVGGTGRG